MTSPTSDPDNIMIVWDDEQLADRLDPAKRRQPKPDPPRRKA